MMKFVNGMMAIDLEKQKYLIRGQFVNYFSNECEPRAFWVSTGSNDVIGEVLAEADEEIYHRLASLVNGETITTYIDTGVIYPQIKKNPSTIYSFLLVTGYLKAVKTTLSFNGDFMCEISLPNREIALVYHKEILQKFRNYDSAVNCNCSAGSNFFRR